MSAIGVRPCCRVSWRLTVGSVGVVNCVRQNRAENARGVWVVVLVRFWVPATDGVAAVGIQSMSEAESTEIRSMRADHFGQSTSTTGWRPGCPRRPFERAEHRPDAVLDL